jgi:hypothetical protein
MLGITSDADMEGKGGIGVGPTWPTGGFRVKPLTGVATRRVALQPYYETSAATGTTKEIRNKGGKHEAEVPGKARLSQTGPLL